jgi:hypothetical protein
MQKNVDLYSVLDLKPQEDNPEVIKKKFKELIAIFHTDKFGSSELNEKLMEAYKILTNPGQKFIYDNFGLSAVKLIKEDHELLKLYEYVIRNCEEADIELMRRFIKRKVIKRLNRGDEGIYNPNELNTDINIMMTVGLFDYLLMKHYYDREVLAMKPVVVSKFTIANSFVLYKAQDNSTEVSLDINTTVSPDKYDLSHDVTVGVGKKLFIPFGKKLWEKNFIDSNFQINISNGVNVASAFTVLNVFKNENLDLVVEPNVSFDPDESRFHLNDCGVGLNINTFNKVKLRYGIFSKSASVNYETKVSKQDRLLWKMTMGSRTNFYILWIRSQKKKAETTTLSFGDGNIALSNTLIISKKVKQFEFKSSLSFILNKKGGIKTSAMFSIVFKYNMFRLEIPLLVSKENNLLTNTLIFLSTIVGNLTLRCLNKYKRGLSKHGQLYNKVNRERQEEYNTTMKGDYDKKVQQETNIGGLVVSNAFVGSFDKIVTIYKHISVFNAYIHDPFDISVSDVKIALNLSIVNSKLDLPKAFTDIQGVFNPDYYSDELYLVIHYKFKECSRLLLLKNNEQPVELPEN